MRRPIVLAIALLTAAGAAHAQSWPSRAGPPSSTVQRSQLDLHRAEMNRLRLEADRREIEARQSRLEARIAVLRTEAARQPDIFIPPAVPRSSHGETARREAVQGGVGQIDAWLDRRSD